MRCWLSKLQGCRWPWVKRIKPFFADKRNGEQSMGQLFIPSNSFYFFNKTDFVQYWYLFKKSSLKLLASSFRIAFNYAGQANNFLLQLNMFSQEVKSYEFEDVSFAYQKLKPMSSVIICFSKKKNSQAIILIVFYVVYWLTHFTRGGVKYPS